MEIKAHSKVGSMDNMKHKPGGGEVKIFDDKSYIKQTAGQMGTPTKSQVNHNNTVMYKWLTDTLYTVMLKI